MEQVISPRVRPTIEEVVYSPSNQCKRYLQFVETVVVEHGSKMSVLELEETIRHAGRVAQACLEKINKREV